MSFKGPFPNLKIAIAGLFILLDGCIDRIQFEIPPPKAQVVIEGMITDGPGPYTVKISQAIDLNVDTVIRAPISQAKLKLNDDQGNTENLTETAPGEYSSGGAIRGQVGHTYYIDIELQDGRTFQSDPDLLKPVGEIQNIKYEFIERSRAEDYGTFKSDIFNILVDAETIQEETESYVRWRFRGTYKVTTSPKDYWIWAGGFPLKRPWFCSGYIVVPQGDDPPEPPGEGRLFKESECVCCECYVRQSESIPQLSDTQLVKNNEFKNVVVGQIPINTETFYDKYLVEIDQMSLSKPAYDFFKLVRAQKEGANSLFQPPSGEIRGNIKPINNNSAVIGIFWATAMRTKSIFIKRSDVPYPVSEIIFAPYPCTTFYPTATYVKPDIW